MHLPDQGRRTRSPPATTRSSSSTRATPRSGPAQLGTVTLGAPVRHPGGRHQLRRRRRAVQERASRPDDGQRRRPRPRPISRPRPRTSSPTRRAARRTRSSWSALTLTRWSRVPASTTTAAAARRSWRSPRRWPNWATPTGCNGGCGSRSGVRRRTGCSVRSTTSGNLNDNQLARHYANLNFDMVGSPNYVRFVYDGDGSGDGPAGPPGSAQIEQTLHRATSPARAWPVSRPRSTVAPTTGRSSRSASRPVVCSPAPRASRPRQQAAIYGGTAGVAYDPCYHQACDTSTT